MYSQFKDEWFITVWDNDKHLNSSKPITVDGPLSPCDMTPDDVDNQMKKGLNRHILEINGMNQESFEYFADKYGETYQYLYFFKSQKISDFSPLSRMPHLQGVSIYWNIKADRLWDMSDNQELIYLHISDCKKLVYDPELLKTSATLKHIKLCGSMWNNYHMKSLQCFEGMTSLEYLELLNITPDEYNPDIISRIPHLKRFDFDPGMLTTKQIAYLCARQPDLVGKCLCAYNKEDASGLGVRVCGKRKPSLEIPKDQKRLDKYVKEFDRLVEKYREDMKKDQEGF